MRKVGGEITSRTVEADASIEALYEVYTQLLPEIGPNWYRHTGIGVNVFTLARILYYYELYKKILDIPGIICEFGVQWGSTMVELTNLRSILEPFNQSRVIVGFDTFEGFTSISPEDGDNSDVGDYKSTPDYMHALSRILTLHEAPAPMAHVKKHELVKGNAEETFSVWLQENPHAIISMAIFDMDLYKPTRDVLQLVTPRLTRGSLLIFDELNCKLFPGETQALQEVLGSTNLKLRKAPTQAFCSWAVWGE